MDKKSHHKPFRLRRAFVKILDMKPEERAAYKPLDGYEEIALTNIERAAKPEKYFEAGKQAKHVADILGEKDKLPKPAPKKKAESTKLVPIRDDGDEAFNIN